MQDRFKMRAWDENNKTMHYDFQFIKSGDNRNDWIIFQSDEQKLDFDKEKNFCINVYPNPYFAQQLKIMQCTGLKDKNGKLIYEADIVEITKEFWNKELYTRYYLVCWDRTQWQLGLFKWQRPKAQNNRRYDRKIPFKDIVSFDDYTPNKYFAQCEVIGNYYENEDLLNE